MADKFAHAGSKATANPMTWLGPASQSNPMRGNVFSDAADNWVSSETAQIPDPRTAPVGTDYATQMMAQYGDIPGAASLMGVRPRPMAPTPAPVYQNPDIYVGGEEAPPPRRALRPLAPSSPNWLPTPRTTGVS